MARKIVPRVDPKPTMDDGGAKIVEQVLAVIGGKWKVLILWHIGASTLCRFGESRRKLPGLTQRMLTNQLRELESAGLVNRKVYAEVPPRTEYTLTEASADLRAVYIELRDWGSRHKSVLSRTRNASRALADKGSRSATN